MNSQYENTNSKCDFAFQTGRKKLVEMLVLKLSGYIKIIIKHKDKSYKKVCENISISFTLLKSDVSKKNHDFD